MDVIEPEPLDPKKLCRPENPLEEAAKFIQPVLQLQCQDVSFWIIAFRVYYHKNKVILYLFYFFLTKIINIQLLVMLQSLNKILLLDRKNESLPSLFSKYMEKCKLNEYFIL